MAATVMPELLDMEVIKELRHLVLAGAGLTQLVALVQQRFGYAPDFIVPVLPYFCRAFSLPLVELLPLREYSKNRDVPELEGLLNKIRKVVSAEAAKGNGKCESVEAGV